MHVTKNLYLQQMEREVFESALKVNEFKRQMIFYSTIKVLKPYSKFAFSIKSAFLGFDLMAIFKHDWSRL